MKKFGIYAVVALIIFVLGAISGSQWFAPDPEIKVERDTVTITKVDSVPFKLIDPVKTKPQPVTISVPKNVISTTIAMDTVEVRTNKYQGKEELSNGTIDWTIYADKLYATEFKLKTEDKVITETITKTLPSRSRLFVMGGIDMDWTTKLPQGVELGLMYNRRQKWGIGVAIRHDVSGMLPPNMSTTAGLRLYVGL